MFSYSVAIRTLGTAGEKYEKLLDSIKRQTIQPEKIIVVLPVGGGTQPSVIHGEEIFVFSSKGMISQRIKALNYIESDYILFCDDDVELDPDFVAKCADALLNSDGVCVSGPLLSFLPPKGFKYVLASLLGGSCAMLHGRKEYYIRVLMTAGYSYNRNVDTRSHRLYKAESLPWTCFLIEKEAMQEIHFEDELWEEKNGYAAFDDETMFYKLCLNGYQTYVVSDAHYKHNDAKASTSELKLEPVYASAFNRYVFWHRFLYEPCQSKAKRLWLKLCITYYIWMSAMYQMMSRKTVDERKIIKKGLDDAKRFLKSEEYKKLPSVFSRKSK